MFISIVRQKARFDLLLGKSIFSEKLMSKYFTVNVLMNISCSLIRFEKTNVYIVSDEKAQSENATPLVASGASPRDLLQEFAGVSGIELDAEVERVRIRALELSVQLLGRIQPVLRHKYIVCKSFDKAVVIFAKPSIAHRLTVLVQIPQPEIRRLQQVQVAEDHIQDSLARALILKGRIFVEV